mmetsp:Transcript_6890/g.9086  ORF Transcript_6890/g.9086 Transcript_6890/m.9086 type:complete len:139 (+) Transcript_6890:905-1321(+)
MEEYFSAQGLFKNNTRMYVSNFSFYIPSDDTFFTVEILIEFLSSGNVHPTYLEVLPFKINEIETKQDKTMLIFQILRCIFCMYTFWLIYLKIHYRSVLGNVTTSIVIDSVQIALMLFPSVIYLTMVNQYSIVELLNND